MPLTDLFVEGELDSTVISSIINFEGMFPAVTPKGTKDGLLPQVLEARKTRGEGIFFQRDRDFDYDILPNVNVPQSIKHPDQQDQIIGWHWCRHEIENYLLEPEILLAYLSQLPNHSVTVAKVVSAIQEAARSLRYYQSARWTIGTSKRKGNLPHPHWLKTSNSKEYRLPQDLGRESSVKWIVANADDFLTSVTATLCEKEIHSRFEHFENAFTEEFCEDVQSVLHFFSGKDLFVAMRPWFREQGIESQTKRIIEGVAEWVKRNPQQALQALPEWRELLLQFKSV